MIKTAIVEQIKHQHYINGVCVSSENHYQIRFGINNDDMVTFLEYLSSISCIYEFDTKTRKQIGINTTEYCWCEIMSNWLLNNGYTDTLSIDGGKSIKFINKG